MSAWLVGWMWREGNGRGRIWGDSTTYVVRQQPAHAGNPFWVSMRRSRRRQRRRQRQREGAPYWIIVMESYWRQRVRQKQQQQKSKEPHFNHVFPPHFWSSLRSRYFPALLSTFWLLGNQCSPPCRRHLSKRRGRKTHTALSQKILPLPSFTCVYSQSRTDRWMSDAHIGRGRREKRRRRPRRPPRSASGDG